MTIPLFFLGAGASREFDIPTMTEMVDRFEEHLKKENLQQITLYSEIKDVLAKGYDKSQIDIESIFSVVQGIADDISPKDMGHYPFYYMKRESFEKPFSDEQKKHAQVLRNELEQFIKNQCKLNDNDDENKKIFERTYDGLFKNIKGITMQMNNAGLYFAEKWICFTTNYDLVFENYWSELAPISDFFHPEGEIPTFDSTKGLGERGFVKLHGSIDWERLEDGNIIKSSSSTPFTRRKKKGTAMLYPIQQKDLYKRPWDTLFQSFKHGLNNSNLWYIIGYALNDEFIFDIFIEKFNPAKKIIIINPHAKELKNKFPESMRSNIDIFQGKFGTKYFPLDFEDFSMNKRTLEIELSSESQKVGIVFPTRVEENFIEIIDNDGFHPDSTVINYHNRGTNAYFTGPKPNKKKIKISVVLNKFTNFKDKIEFRAFTTENQSIDVTISNQGRIISTFTANEFLYDDDFIEHVSEPESIPIEYFWP